MTQVSDAVGMLMRFWVAAASDWHPNWQPMKFHFESAVQDRCAWLQVPGTTLAIQMQRSATGRWERLAEWLVMPRVMAFYLPTCVAYVGCPAQVAEQCFGKAASLAPEFAFASGNQALALFQLGETDRAVRQMR